MCHARHAFIQLFKMMKKDILTEEHHRDHFHSICIMVEETPQTCFPRTFDREYSKGAKRALNDKLIKLGFSLWSYRKQICHFKIYNRIARNKFEAELESFQEVINMELKYWR